MAAASSTPFHFLFLVIRLVNNCSSDYPTLSQHNLTMMTVVTLDYCDGQLPRERPYVGTWSIDRCSTMPSYNCSCSEDDPMTELEIHKLTEFANYNSMCFRRNEGTSILGAKTILPHKGGFFANGTWAICPCSSRDDEPRTDGGTTPNKLGVHFAASNAPDACRDYRALAAAGTFLEEHGTRLLSLIDVSPDYINDQVPEALARKLLDVHDNPTKVEPGHLKEVVTRKERKFGVGARVATAVSALLGLFCTVSGLLRWCMLRKKRRGTMSVEDQLFSEMGPIRYTYSELVAATSNFAEEKMLGKGGFGPVYQGYLNDQSRHVAVKMFSSGLSSRGRKEFEAEVKIMSRLRHRNLVQLVGWCDRQGLLLVYELVPGGSLDKHLHDPERILTWAERYRIALGLGSAILYLHTECNQCVVHGDIKPSNVMLDLSGNAKLGDFGLARLVNHGAELQTTDIVAGTVGYIDPEFVNNRKPTTESDVYSFGVVLLEIACGRRPMPPAGQSTEASTTLLKRVRNMYDQNAILEAAEGKLNGAFNERQMERVLVTGLWCVTRDQNRRPSIAQAMSILRSEDAELPVLPAAMHGGSEQIRFLEEQVYGDLSVDSDRSTCSSAATAYHTPEDSSYLYREEWHVSCARV